MPNLSAYTPSIFALLLASFFISFPILAVVLVSGSLVAFALIYASIITRLWKMQKNSRDSFSAAPGFKNVTFQMFEKSGTWFKSPK